MTNILPLVSIVIPAYNTAQYITQTIESLFRQTHKNIEVIVVDDGSTDDTLSVLQKYAAGDERVRVFTQENAGVSAARNHGIREARGDYLIFLDSDDWLEDDAIEILLDTQRQYPDKLVSALFCDVDEHGEKKCRNKILQDTIVLDIHDIAEAYCGVRPEATCFHSACAKIYSTEIVAKYGIYFPEGISLSEDAVFVIKYLYKVDGAVLVNKYVYDVLNRSGSAVRSVYTPAKLQAQIDAYDILINLPENTPEIKKLMSISRTQYIIDYITNALHGFIAGIGSKEAAKIRSYLKPYVHEFVSYDKFSLKRKVRFLLVEMYMPLWLGKGIMSLWKCCKAIIGKK